VTAVYNSAGREVGTFSVGRGTVRIEGLTPGTYVVQVGADRRTAETVRVWH
jgi:hypothetical protein